MYLTPPVNINKLESFLNSVDAALNNIENVVIVGDFNLYFINWHPKDDVSYMIPSNYHKPLGYQLTDFLAFNNLYQANSVKNLNGNILDLTISSFHNASVSQPMDLLSKLDPHHPQILFTIPFTVLGSTFNLPLTNRHDFNFFKANFDSILPALRNAEWHEIFNSAHDVNSMVSSFHSILNDIITDFVPRRKPKNSKCPVLVYN